MKSVPVDGSFARLAGRVVPGGRLHDAQPLPGGVSAILHAVEIEAQDGSIQRFAVRRHPPGSFRRPSESTTATEFALARALDDLGFAVPRPVLLDDSCDVFPTPVFVMELVDGTTAVSDPDLEAALAHMAGYLACVHSIDVETTALPALPDLEDPLAGLLELLPPGRIGEELRSFVEAGTCYEPARRTLLHGDFWPGNVLWRDGNIVAVIDWEDASLGDPLSDLAAARVELACAYGREAMDTFTSCYVERAHPDLGHLDLWEAYVSSSALAYMSDWGLEPEDEAKRRRVTGELLALATGRLSA